MGSDAEDRHVVITLAYLPDHLDVGIHVAVGFGDCRRREVVGAEVDHDNVGATPFEVERYGG